MRVGIGIPSFSLLLICFHIESCLLKDLGIAEQEIKENSYSKLGVISRTNERGFIRDTMGALGSLLEELNDGGQKHNNGFRFSIPTIVESLASIRVGDAQLGLVQFSLVDVYYLTVARKH